MQMDERFLGQVQQQIYSMKMEFPMHRGPLKERAEDSVLSGTVLEDTTTYVIRPRALSCSFAFEHSLYAFLIDDTRALGYHDILLQMSQGSGGDPCFKAGEELV